tara:strand:+ start:59 stop:694 length:636 start_codon:yes stop_codon:yes gene_type:complete
MKLNSGSRIKMQGTGPPVLFSTGWFGMMPREFYSKLLSQLEKNNTIITLDGGINSPSDKIIEDISDTLAVKSIGFLSHSSIPKSIFNSNKINKAIMMDPIVVPPSPQLSYFDTFFIKAEKSYRSDMGIPEFLTPNVPHEGMFYMNVGHPDILDNFWADIAEGIGFWNMADIEKVPFNKWNRNQIQKMRETKYMKRMKYRKDIAKIVSEYFN